MIDSTITIEEVAMTTDEPEEPTERDTEEDTDEPANDERDTSQEPAQPADEPTDETHALTTIAVIAFDWACDHGPVDPIAAREVWDAAKLLRPELEPTHIPEWRQDEDIHPGTRNDMPPLFQAAEDAAPTGDATINQGEEAVLTHHGSPSSQD